MVLLGTGAMERIITEVRENKQKIKTHDKNLNLYFNSDRRVLIVDT